MVNLLLQNQVKKDEQKFLFHNVSVIFYVDQFSSYMNTRVREYNNENEDVG